MGMNWLCFLWWLAEVSLESVAGRHRHQHSPRSQHPRKVHIAVLTGRETKAEEWRDLPKATKWVSCLCRISYGSRLPCCQPCARSSRPLLFQCHRETQDDFCPPSLEDVQVVFLRTKTNLAANCFESLCSANARWQLWRAWFLLAWFWAPWTSCHCTEVL